MADSTTAGDDGCDVERRFEAGKRAENRDWNPGRRPPVDDVGGGIPLVEDGRDGGAGSGKVEVEEVLSWRSSSS